MRTSAPAGNQVPSPIPHWQQWNWRKAGSGRALRCILRDSVVMYGAGFAFFTSVIELIDAFSGRLHSNQWRSSPFASSTGPLRFTSAWASARRRRVPRGLSSAGAAVEIRIIREPGRFIKDDSIASSISARSFQAQTSSPIRRLGLSPCRCSPSPATTVRSPPSSSCLNSK